MQILVSSETINGTEVLSQRKRPSLSSVTKENSSPEQQLGEIALVRVTQTHT